MWNSLLSSTDAAKERFVSVFEKTGEILHQKATAHVRHTKSEQPETNLNASPPEPTTSDIQEGGGNESNPKNLKVNSFFINPTVGVSNYIKALRNTNDNDTTDESAINHRAKEVLDTLKVGWGSVIKVVESTQKAVEKEMASLQAAALLQKGSFRICTLLCFYFTF